MNFFNKFNRLKVKYKDSPSIKISFLLGVVSILLIFIGSSYAFIFKSAYTESINKITAGNLVMTLENTTPVISIGNAVPTPDDVAISSSDYYGFTLKNNGSINAKYKISLINSCVVGNTYTVGSDSVVAGVCVPTKYIKAGISKDGEDYKVLSPDSSGNIILDSSVLGKLRNSSYKLKLWLDYDTPNEYNVKDKNIIISVKLQLYSEQTTENPVTLDKSGANAPELTSNVIPVYYDETNAVWRKADVNNLDKNNKWYDYDNKMWANAVTVTETNRSTYLSADAGTEISMDDINTMWVWIPRYTYTYLNTNTPEEIKIKFESGTSSSGTIKCTDAVTRNGTTSQTCTDATNGSLKAGTSTYTHPAFTFGDKELKGLWVGKFESSATSILKSESTAESTVIIKPNVQTLRYKRLSYFFRDARQMERANNVYGFPQSSSTTFNWNGNLTGDTNNIDIHMMKNTEWGAVTYLYHSKYGRCTSGTCEELTVNNCSTYTTGIGADTVSASKSDTTCTTDKNKYNGESGVKASTTGNVYGVYDMSGGLYEYTMGNMVNSSNKFQVSSAGNWSTTTTPLSKYYDSYTYNTSYTTYTRGRLGDATVEMAPTGIKGNWYSDVAYFPNSSISWFLRGGAYGYGTGAGAFNFNYDNGSANSVYSFRVSFGAQAS